MHWFLKRFVSFGVLYSAELPMKPKGNFVSTMECVSDGIDTSNLYHFKFISNGEIHATNGNIRRRSGKNNLLKFSALNVRGGLKDKLPEVEMLLNKYNIHLLGTSETNQLKDDVIQTNDINYNFEPCFNYSESKTRLGVFIHKSLTYKIRRDKMKKLKMPTVWIELKTSVSNILVINVYREFKMYLPKSQRAEAHKSNSLKAQFERFNEFVHAWENAMTEYDEVWVLGDMNLDLSKIRKDPNSDKKDFLRLIDDRVFTTSTKQLIDGHTWVRDNGLQSSCIDHIYTNSNSYIGVTITDCNISDHKMVSVVRSDDSKYQKPALMKIRSFKDFVFDDYDWYLRNIGLDDILEIDDPEEQVLRLTAAINVVADQTCPIKKVRSKQFSTSWMTKELQGEIDKRDNLYKQYRGLVASQGSSDQTDSLYKQYKKLKNYLRRAIPKRKEQYNTEKINTNRTENSAVCWKLMNINAGRNEAFAPPIILEEGGETIKDPKIIAEKFAEYFDHKVKNIHDNLPDARDDDLPDWPDDLPRFEFQKVTSPDIVSCIKSLSNSTATGWDFISNKLVKCSTYQISKVLANITNKCFSTGKFPESWKLARVIPLHKKGSRTSTKNYRPIALLCSLSKVVERAVFNQIHSHFKKFDLFDKRQYGFRPGHSTTLAVLDLMQVITEAKNGLNQEKVNTLLLDLSAAFDIVSHNLLLKKLDSFGFSANAISFIKSYLTNRVVEVQVETSISKRVPIRYGVPQGSVLGPLLYVVMITDIQKINHHAKIIYADDTNCVVKAKTSDDLNEATDEAMKNLIDYYHDVRLKLNAEKTQIINHDSKLGVVSVKINNDTGDRQESVHHARVLGIRLDSGLDFKIHIENLVSDVKGRITQLRKLPKGVTLKARRMMGIGIVLSKIYYGLPIYASACRSDLKRVEVSYNAALRAILNVSKKRKIKMTVIRRHLGLLSFNSLIRYFDVTTLQRIILTGQPYHLFKYLKITHSRNTRAASNETVRTSFVPRNEKSSRSFLTRSLRSYNSLPIEIRKLTGKRFNAAVKDFYYERENQEPVPCLIS